MDGAATHGCSVGAPGGIGVQVPGYTSNRNSDGGGLRGANLGTVPQPQDDTSDYPSHRAPAGRARAAANFAGVLDEG